MEVFFDTEFTTLDSINGCQALISIGCVAKNGREFYAELTDTWQEGMCSDFVIETVLPLLDCGDFKMMEAQLALRLHDWIEALTDKEVTLKSDAPGFDWPFVAELFQRYEIWPKNLRRRCGSVYFYNHRQAFKQAQALVDYWNLHGARQHHALVDARSLQYANKYATKNSQGLNR